MTSSATDPAGDLGNTIAAVLGRGAVRGVASAYLFGSQAEGRAHRDSDVDIGVVLCYSEYPAARDRFEGRLRLGTELAAALGREADVIVLNDAPPLLARRIVVAGRRVFCADPEADHAFVRDAQLRAADLEPFLRRARRTKLIALAR